MSSFPGGELTFNASIPATATAFHDRTAELERLGRAVKALVEGRPEWIAILGSRKIGKTSLLLEAARRSARPGLAFVLVDAFEQVPVTLEILRRSAVRALDAALGGDLPVALEPLLGRPAEYRAALVGTGALERLPHPLRATVLELPTLRLDEAGLRAVVDLPERLARALGLHIVSAWDEFQEIVGLGGRGSQDLMPFLRSVWQTRRHVAYVISGSARALLEDLFSSRGSPFFQHFSVLELGPFSRDDAVGFLVESAPRGKAIPRSLAEEAWEKVGGHPFYLQLVGDALTRGAELPSGPSLKDALAESLFSRSGRLCLYFENEFHRIVGRSTTLAATLDAIAEGPRRLTDIAREIGSKSGATAGYLERLADAVRRGEDGLYGLSDPVFGLWLRWRRPGGSVVPMKVLGDEAELAVAEALARLGFDLVYQSRGSRGAIDLLATRGPRQIGIQVERTSLPLRFSKAEWSRMEAESKRFGWRWAVAVVTPAPGEEVAFLDPGHARRRRACTLTRDAEIGNLLAWVDAAG